MAATEANQCACEGTGTRAVAEVVTMLTGERRRVASLTYCDCPAGRALRERDEVPF